MIGLLRVKNEARWLAGVLRSIQPVCDAVYVFDDHSTDETPAVARAEGAWVWHSPFDGLDEARDKDWMLDRAKDINPDWVLMVDGDEVLSADSIPAVRAAVKRTNTARYSFRILYLWDRPDQIRVDGVYREFRRTSMFRVAGQPQSISFARTSHGGNFHCKSHPQGLIGAGLELDAKLLHYGYMLREDRIRKYQFYTSKDPGSAYEDGYRHIVQGDLPEVPASARLKWGGPLTLAPLVA